MHKLGEIRGMKKKTINISIILIIIVISIFVCGIFTQKYYGLGNILEELNPNYINQSKTEYLKKEHQGKISIYILAGQSNMEGHGELKELTPFDTQNKVYVFDENYKWIIGKEPVRAKVGPSIAFASEISKKTGEIVGIINVAVGGTNIEQWLKSKADNSLYQRLLKRALASSAQGEIKGLLFYQGESDAEGDNTGHIDDWNVEFEKFVKKIRKDLKNDSLPIVFAQIGKGNEINWKRVKASQEKVNLVNVIMIKTEDIEKNGSNIHYNTKGYIEIGKRFADKYIEVFTLPDNGYNK